METSIIKKIQNNINNNNNNINSTQLRQINRNNHIGVENLENNMDWEPIDDVDDLQMRTKTNIQETNQIIIEDNNNSTQNNTKIFNDTHTRESS